ncbi:carbohydrate ABC transporter permease [Dorea sp. D27]|uniref:carbohydrate ABC transporter permease n=1 Tax=Dorea sp. D27 TaxID=658665 RepID=UPI0006732664|nr:sugar ABC transporter permease [Dorea sp. D27]KMZ52417.1 putative ABC transporter, permease protein [Dorea sp. D27]
MRKKLNNIMPYLYSTPFFILIFLFMLCPFVLNIGISFTNYSMNGKDLRFVGIKNYGDVLSNPGTWSAIRLTVIFIIGCVGLTMLLGMFYAVVMTFKIKGNILIKAFILMPWIIPESVTAYVWKWLFSSDTGMIYYLLEKAGLIADGTSFFFDGVLAMAMVIMANVWRTAPFVAVMTYAKLSAVPDSYIEAAKMDGANALQSFRYIKLPWIGPILSRCTMLLFVWSFNSFSIIYILTNGGPAGATTTLPYLIRQSGFQNFNFAQATALSVIALVIILLCFAVFRAGAAVWKLYRKETAS